MDFEILGSIRDPESFAQVSGIQLRDGTVLEAEIHWYEASGIGKQFKIKRYIITE